MVKHIIIWTLKNELSDDEKQKIKSGIKSGLEGLVGRIDGLLDIKVITNILPSSKGDVMLDSTFESAEALKAYSAAPEHIKVADAAVRPFIADRKCIDYEIR